MEVIKIGRTEVDKEAFIKAVAEAHSVAGICRILNLNDNVVSTKQNIRNRIKELGLSTDHLIYYGWKPSEELLDSKVKKFDISKDNQIYLDVFLNSLKQQSMSTYKSSCGNFMETLGDQDFATINSSQIEEFASHKNTEAMVRNVIAHIKSCITYIILNDINRAKEKANKDMLIWLIER